MKEYKKDRRERSGDRRDSKKSPLPKDVDRRHSQADRRQSSPDRRKSKRLKKHFILTYHPLDDPSANHDASQIQDITEKGTCFTTSQAFLVSTKLVIKLKTPFFDEAVIITGTVVASTEKIKGSVYETHLVFDDLANQAQAVINRILSDSNSS